MVVPILTQRKLSTSKSSYYIRKELYVNIRKTSH